MERRKIGAWKGGERDRKSAVDELASSRDEAGKVFSHGAKYNRPAGRSVRTWRVRRVRRAIVRRRESSACKFPRAFKEALSERVESRRADTPRDTGLFFLSDTRADFRYDVRASMDSQAFFYLPPSRNLRNFRYTDCSRWLIFRFKVYIPFFKGPA